MSLEALEHAVYDLGTDRALRSRFKEDPEAFLGLYRLTEIEADMLRRFDVRAMQAAGVNAMACMGFWATSAPDRSMPRYVEALRPIEDLPNG